MRITMYSYYWFLRIAFHFTFALTLLKIVSYLFVFSCVHSSRPGRPPKRASSVGLSLAASASHLSHQLKKHRLENGDYVAGVYENGHLQGNNIILHSYNQIVGLGVK